MFKFSLEKSLGWLVDEEKYKRLEIAKIISEIEKERALREGAIRKIRSLLELSIQSELLWTGFSAERVPFERHAIYEVEKRIQKLEVHLKEKKKELSLLSMRKKGLESLKEKRRREYRMQRSRSEQKALDERYEILRMLDTSPDRYLRNRGGTT